MNTIKPFDSEDCHNAKIVLTNKCVVNAIAEYLERRGYSRNTEGHFVVSFQMLSPGKVEATTTIGFDGGVRKLKEERQDPELKLQLD